LNFAAFSTNLLSLWFCSVVILSCLNTVYSM
jgi:hypothetical protein